MTGSEQNKLVSSFLTTQLGFAVIPGGTQRFHFHYLKQANNDNIEAYVTIQLADLTGTPIGPTISSGIAAVGWIDASTPDEVTTDITLPTTGIDPTNRMIVKLYLNNNNSSAHSTTWYTEGNSYYSFVITSVGVIGNQGATGPQGFQGVQGYQGPTGTGNYYVQDSSPTASINSGDRWYDLTTGLEYVWINDGDSYQWVAPASTGPQGPTGLQGSIGPTGSQGATGPSGVTVGSFGLTIDGGVLPITIGSKGYVSMPYGGIITGWDILSTVSGSIQIDLKKGSYSTFPTTTSITSTNYISITSGYKNTDSTLTGWGITFSQGDIYEFTVISASTLTKVNVVVRTNKT